MLLIHDHASMQAALASDLDPKLLAILRMHADHLAAGEHDLTDCTEFLVVQPGQTEADIVRHVGFSPLVEPIDGARYPDPAFQPFWDLLIDRGGWFELVVTFGSTFASVLLIEDAEGVPPTLLALCRRYAET